MNSSIFWGVYSSTFGMQINERTWEALSDGYRFGFNGKERDDKVSGSGNSIAFEARIYDSRLGRFLSVDKKYYQFPFESNYTYVSNCPLFFIDSKGNHKVHPEIKKKYPTLANFLENELIDYAFNCSEIWDSYQTLTGASEEQIGVLFQSNSGIVEFRIFDFDQPQILGQTTDKHTIDSETGEREIVVDFDEGTIQFFEDIIASPSSDQFDKEAAKLAIVMLVLHESAHVLLNQATKGAKTNGLDGEGTEVGERIEMAIYGAYLMELVLEYADLENLTDKEVQYKVLKVARNVLREKGESCATEISTESDDSNSDSEDDSNGDEDDHDNGGDNGSGGQNSGGASNQTGEDDNQ